MYANEAKATYHYDDDRLRLLLINDLDYRFYPFGNFSGRMRMIVSTHKNHNHLQQHLKNVRSKR